MKPKFLIDSLRNYWYIAFLVLVGAGAYWWGCHLKIWERGCLIYDLFASIIGSAVTIVLFTITYDVLKRATAKNEIKESIVKSLGAEKDIIQKYKDNEIFKIVNNCSGRLLGEHLANGMKNVIFPILKNPSYRKRMEYEIEIFPNKGGDLKQYIEYGDAAFCILQTLRYKKYVKRGGGSQFKLSCFFSFNTNPFLPIESGLEEIFFLREELSNPSFINSLTEENAISLLNYSVTFWSEKERIETKFEDSIKINVSFVMSQGKKVGIKFTSDVPNEVLNYGRDGYIYFDAEIKCSYPTSRREFYFKVPELTWHADVLIVLNSPSEELHLVSFTDNYRIESGKNRGRFRHGPENEEILLPNNGFTAVW